MAIQLSTILTIASVLQSLVGVASLGMGFHSCAVVRWKKDSVRRGLRWISMIFFGLFFSAGSFAVQSAFDSYSFGNGYTTSPRLLTTFYYVAGFVGRPVRAAILYLIFETSFAALSSNQTVAGTVSKIDNAKKQKRQHGWNLAAFAAVNILSAAAYLGTQVLLRRVYLEIGVAVLPTYQIITAVTELLLFIGAVAALAVSSRAVSSSSAQPAGTAATLSHIRPTLGLRDLHLVLVAAILFIIQSLWTAAESIILNIMLPMEYEGYEIPLNPSRFSIHTVAHDIVDYYINLIALVLLFVAAQRSNLGLWPSPSAQDQAQSGNMVQNPGNGTPELDSGRELKRDGKSELAGRIDPVAPHGLDPEQQQLWQQKFELSHGDNPVAAVELDHHQQQQRNFELPDRFDPIPRAELDPATHLSQQEYHQIGHSFAAAELQAPGVGHQYLQYQAPNRQQHYQQAHQQLYNIQGQNY